ncbi:MAG: dienelactone hydrolase family protein [Armatimonadetes bacterium]|nr:dienelactone hydrolase family protein [Armatimonadota bacterium]MDE2207492.1 dienelactone hydrolase family protein [Armatimonadota bacterium]
MPNSRPDGFLSVPTVGSGAPVLVLHAWWGLNDTIRGICARLAEEGFVAFAPDLYHGKVTNSVAEAETLVRALNRDPDHSEAVLAEAARFVTEHADRSDRGLAVIGFSLGANFALDVAVGNPENVRSVVLFYGTSGGDFSASKAAYLGHFAENDPFEPRSEVDNLEQSLERAGRPVTFHHYAGAGHWFFEPDRADSYDAEAAQLAWDRTLAFLKRPADG